MPTTNSITVTGQARIIPKFALIIGTTDVHNDMPPRLYDGSPNALSFSSPLRQRATATIELILGTTDSFLPVRGNPVYIFHMGVRVYAGMLQIPKVVWIGESGHRKMSLSCTSFEIIFDSILVYPPRVYVNKSSGYIFADLFNAFCLGTPVKLGVVEPGVLIPLLVLKGGERISDIYTQLTTTSDFVWGVDPTDLTAYHRAQSTNAAPFSLGTTDIQWETTVWEQDPGDFRDRQLNRMSMQQNPPSNVLFAGDSLTKVFAIPYLPDSLVQVNLTTSTQATATCTFTGVPAPGDYTNIGSGLISTRYTFVAVVDNTQPWEVLIGATAAACAQNLADAINANPATIGTSFSFPTLENPTFNAKALSGLAFPLLCKVPGSGRALIQVTISSAFSWGSIADGTDGVDDPNLNAGTDYIWPVLT